MKILLNGSEIEVRDNLSIDELLKERDISSEKVVAELNHSIIKRYDYNRTILKEGDKIEVLSFVGGGGWATG